MYDFFPLDEDRLFFAIGDVSDKGMPAALFMAITRTALRMSALANPNDIAATLEAVNRFLCDRNDSGMFVTAFCGVFDVRTGLVEYSDGGHEPPYVVRAGQAVEAVTKVGGLALGFMPDVSYSTGYIQLNPGDTLVLYTDGVTEALNHNRDMFESEGMEKTLSRFVHTGGCRDIVDALLADVRVFAGGAPQSDDITILALRKQP